MSGMRSRRRGKRGEYIVRDRARLWGFVGTRRGIQAAGEADLADMIPGYHVEVKNQETLNIWAALAQAERDAVAFFEKRWEKISPALRPRPDRPIVFFKRNHSKLYAALDADHLFELLRLEATYAEFKELNDERP